MGTADTDLSMTSIVLIRHGQSVANAERLIGGYRSCQGLTDLGREEASALARRLAVTGELDGAVLMASNYRRAIETAAVIGDGAGLGEPAIDEAFGEIDPGPEYDGLSYDEFLARNPDFSWPTDPGDRPFPGGESIGELYARVVEGLERVADVHAGRTVGIASHGGVVEMALRYVTGAGTLGVFDLWTVNASLTGLTRGPTGRWRIDRYNDAAHLHHGAWLDGAGSDGHVAVEAAR